jgi:uncharacterized NAD(P)/FAD-binding protein YdhS
MSGPIELAVVGGGASAVCLLDALAQADRVPDGITVFEPAPALWRGRPFRRDLPSVRVNAPAEEMSVRAGDTGHFQRWLAGAGPGSAPADPYCGVPFVARGVYGDYLEEAANAALLRLYGRGCRIGLVRAPVTAAGPVAGGIELCTEPGDRCTVDQLVLCVGGGPPADGYGLAGRPGFVAEPYPAADRLAEIDPTAEVGVLGCGLTGVDVVLALAARGHHGLIRMLSRSGVLPGVRQRPVPYTLRHFTAARFRRRVRAGHPLALPELVELMRVELRAAGEDLGPIAEELAALTDEPPLVRLRRNLGEVDSPGLALRILQRAVPDTGPDVWPYLAEPDRVAILARYYRALMSLCCPMPPASAAALLALAETGQLEIVSGVRAVRPGAAGGFVVTGSGPDRTVNVVVNAVNSADHRIPPGAAALVDSLVAAGLGQRHPRGGLCVDRATSRLTVAGVPDARVSALGDLTAGSLLFTFGVPSLVDRAEDIANTFVHSGSFSRRWLQTV